MRVAGEQRAQGGKREEAGGVAGDRGGQGGVGGFGQWAGAPANPEREASLRIGPSLHGHPFFGLAEAKIVTTGNLLRGFGARTPADVQKQLHGGTRIEVSGGRLGDGARGRGTVRDCDQRPWIAGRAAFNPPALSTHNRDFNLPHGSALIAGDGAPGEFSRKTSRERVPQVKRVTTASEQKEEEEFAHIPDLREATSTTAEDQMELPQRSEAILQTLAAKRRRKESSGVAVGRLLVVDVARLAERPRVI